MSLLKQKLHQRCLLLLQERIRSIDTIMASCQDAANSQALNSPGDQRGTGRAVMQLDRENHAVQRVNALQELQKIRSLDIDKPRDIAEEGALVYTDNGIFFFAISAGKVIIEEQEVHIISITSPIGQAFYGAEEEEDIVFRNKDYEVIEIC